MSSELIHTYKNTANSLKVIVKTVEQELKSLKDQIMKNATRDFVFDPDTASIDNFTLEEFEGTWLTIKPQPIKDVELRINPCAMPSNLIKLMRDIRDGEPMNVMIAEYCPIDTKTEDHVVTYTYTVHLRSNPVESDPSSSLMIAWMTKQHTVPLLAKFISRACAIKLLHDLNEFANSVTD